MAEPSSPHHPMRNNSLLDEQVKGTTLTLIGEHTIYVATDERCCHMSYPYMIRKDDYPKTFVIANNVLATLTGEANICRRMLTHAKLRVEEGVAAGLHGNNDIVHVAATYAMEYVVKWEHENPNKRFPSSALIVGWAMGVPSVYEVASGQQLSVTHARGNGFVVGSGEPHVYSYYNLDPPLSFRRGQPSRSDKELGQIAKRAVVYSALNEPYTGGSVRLVEVREDEINESDPEEILKVLYDDYDKFKTHLSCIIFCLYRKNDYEYASDTEMILGNAINIQFAPKIEGNGHVIEIKEKYFIRILRFKDDGAAKEVFETLKSEWKNLGYGHTQDVEVHPFIRGLPWIEFDQLRSVPLVFAQPTKNMIELFLDL